MFYRITLITSLFAAASSSGLASSWDFSAPDRKEHSQLDDAPTRHNLFDDASAGSFHLMDAGITSPQELIAATLEQHEQLARLGCFIEARLYDQEQSAGNKHSYYKLYCNEQEILNTHLSWHEHHEGALSWQINLPEIRDLMQGEDAWWPHDLTGYRIRSKKKAYAIVEHNLVPVWLVSAIELATNKPLQMVYDRRHGANYLLHAAGFGAMHGTVYVGGYSEENLQIVTLDRLDQSGFLNGSDFRVYSDKFYERLAAVDGEFIATPYENEAFDQLQTYYNLHRTKKWFTENFGYEDPQAMGAVVNAIIFGTANNAMYDTTAPADEPRLYFGIGTPGVMINLARDLDVAMHEYAHHVIFRRISSDRGDAARLHEGFADYFVYAYKNEPLLGTTILPGKKSLRQATIAEDRRYDNPAVSRQTHSIGQIWSAALWQMRQIVGQSFDQVVYASLNYLGPQSHFGDAIAALILADADLHGNSGPSLPLHAATRSPHYCAIISQAVARGFAGMMAGLDGAPCGIDLVELSRSSSSNLEPEKAAGKEPGYMRVCGVLGHGQKSSGAVMLLMALPLLLVILQGSLTSRRRQRLWI